MGVGSPGGVPEIDSERRFAEANLVLLALLLALALGRLGADLLVVLLEGGEVLAGLWVWRRGKRVSVGCRDGVLGC